MTVTVDWAPVDKAVRQLTDGIDTGSKRVALEAATETAGEIRRNLPKRTGRLAATVGVEAMGDAAGVSYGGGLPYATYIERRTSTVADAVQEAERRYGAAQTEMAAREVRRL